MSVTPLAWLIKHTENQQIESFPLYNGLNYIGRLPINGENNILVKGDNFVSRNHAIIFIENTSSIPTIFIQEYGHYKNVRKSRNGIYINGDERRITFKTRLFTNDTIQVGMTKLVLKLNNDHLDNIVTQVQDTGYMKTIVINIF